MVFIVYTFMYDNATVFNLVRYVVLGFIRVTPKIRFYWVWFLMLPYVHPTGKTFTSYTFPGNILALKYDSGRTCVYTCILSYITLV